MESTRFRYICVCPYICRRRHRMPHLENHLWPPTSRNPSRPIQRGRRSGVYRSRKDHDAAIRTIARPDYCTSDGGADQNTDTRNQIRRSAPLSIILNPAHPTHAHGCKRNRGAGPEPKQDRERNHSHPTTRGGVPQ